MPRRGMGDLLAEQDEALAADAAAIAIRNPVAPSPLTAATIPDPPAEAGDGPLAATEQADLTTCEAALDNLRMAFWAAGKALQTIRDGCLYRSTHDTFEDYAGDRWGMTARHAYRLIAAWPVAERVSPVSPDLTESQVRELLPVADNHGPDAAAVVYQAVAETDGVRVTADILRDVAAILPKDHFDAGEAAQQIRGYLNSDRSTTPLRAVNPVKVFSVADKSISKLLEQVTTDGLEAARAADPELVARIKVGMRAVLDRLEDNPPA